MKDKIEFSEFLELEKKLEIRIGTITEASRIPKSDKLLQMAVSFGPKIGTKICVTNLGGGSEPEEFLDCTMPFIMNLKPSKMMGVESEVMIMVGEDDDLGITTYEMNDYLRGSKLL